MQINSITLVGRAAGDPVVRYYESGSVRAVFDLLVSRRSSDDVDVFPVELWGKQAQTAADYVRKNALVGVVGSIKRGFGDPVNESQVYVRVDRLELLAAPSSVT